MLELLVGGGFGVPSDGAEELLYGTTLHGYYGEVQAANLINGDTLANQIGLSEGVSYNSNTGWLKFALNNRTLYVAKQPLRYAISWEAINAAGAVIGTTQITINGKQYIVRLLNGRGDGKKDYYSDGFDVTVTHGSEWNRLMYHVSGKSFEYTQNTLASEGITEGNWAQFSEAELLTSASSGYGSYSWCQGMNGTASSPMVRGYFGVSYTTSTPFTNQHQSYGWRPVLELME